MKTGFYASAIFPVTQALLGRRLVRDIIDLFPVSVGRVSLMMAISFWGYLAAAKGGRLDPQGPPMSTKASGERIDLIQTGHGGPFLNPGQAGPPVAGGAVCFSRREGVGNSGP